MYINKSKLSRGISNSRYVELFEGLKEREKSSAHLEERLGEYHTLSLSISLSPSS